MVVAVSAPEPCSFCGAPADRADAVGLEWSAFPEREVACSAAHAARLVATRTLGVVARCSAATGSGGGRPLAAG